MMCLTGLSPECEFSINNTILKAGKTYRLPRDFMLGLASKDTPDLFLALRVSWRFLPLDDSWRDVPHTGQATSNPRKRICPE